MKTETVNLERVAYLNSLTDLQLKTIAYDADEFAGIDGETWNWKGYCFQLRSYFKQVIAGGSNEYQVSYKKSTNNRMYLDKMGGIQILQRHIRGFVCDGEMTDYDMKNCHPVLAKYLCDKHKIYCPMLTNYCNNREDCWIKMNPLIDSKEELKIRGKIGVLVKMNTDKVGGKGWLKSFSQEMYEIKIAILDKEPSQLSTNLVNPLSSQFNKLLCHYENELLQSAIADNNCCVPMYDGFLSKEQVDLDWLNKLGKKYGITWCVKEHSKKIKLPDDWSMNDVDKDYTAAKRIFEKSNAFINIPVGIMRRNCNGWSLIDIKSFKDIYSFMPHFIDDRGQRNKFTTIWLQDPDRLTYEMRDFYPHNKNPCKLADNVFNTFTPFNRIDAPVSPNSQDYINNYVKPLILELCEANPEMAEYLENRISHKIQYPEVLSEVMVIMKGRSGNGKDTLVSLIEKIMNNPDYTLRTGDAENIFGKFNSGLTNKLVCQLNEQSDAKAIEFLERMKDLSTAVTINIQQKGKDIWPMRNCLDVYIVSNNNRPVVVGEDDRRCFLIKTTDKYQQDASFFKPFWDGMEDEGIMNGVFKYFNDRDITGFKPREFPKGVLYEDLQADNVKPIYKFVYDLDVNEFITRKKYPGLVWISRPEFRQLFVSWCNYNGYAGEKTNPKTILLNMSDFKQWFVSARAKINGKMGDYYGIDIDGIKTVLRDTYHFTDDSDMENEEWGGLLIESPLDE